MATFPFTYKSSSVYPGAFLINGGNGSFPIFCSITSYSTWGMNNIDNYYLIMPGYSLRVYKEGSYTSDSWPIDNSNSTTPIYWSGFSSDNCSSCSLYFGTVDVGLNEIIVNGISNTNPQA